MRLETLLSALENDGRERLRWRVLREFGVLPGSRQARKLSDIDCIICGLHMMLDMRRNQKNEAGPQNPAFDSGRFEVLRGGAK